MLVSVSKKMSETRRPLGFPSGSDMNVSGPESFEEESRAGENPLERHTRRDVRKSERKRGALNKQTRGRLFSLFFCVWWTENGDAGDSIR